MIITEDATSASVRKLLMSKPDAFKDVRLYSMASLADYAGMDKNSQSVCQMRAIMIGNLIMLHKEGNIVTGALLEEMLQNRLDETSVPEFIANIPEKENETPKQRQERLNNFLRWHVSLVELLGKQLRLLEKFVWSAA